MHYKLVGFSQDDSVRRYAFERILRDGTSAAAFTVVANVALARKLRITLQELPSLCSRLLESGGDDQPAGTVFLTDADLEVHAAANRSVAQQDEAKRALRSRRNSLAAAAKNEKNQGIRQPAIASDQVTP
jgi:hypothetical protein